MKKICIVMAAIAISTLFSCGSTKVPEQQPEADLSTDMNETESSSTTEQSAATDSAEQSAAASEQPMAAKQPAAAVAGKSGDYPNMDRGAKESEVPAPAQTKNESAPKRVAVAKRAEDVVVVDNLPNIVQENESVLFSSDWDEESLSDPEDCGYFYTTDSLGEFSSITGEFRKLGGYEGSTVGFVFGFTPTKDGWLKDYIRFEINTRGEYGIYSYVNNRYTDLVQKNKPDTAYLYESAAINAGYNRRNTLTIQKEKDGTYTLSINDTVVAKKVPPLKKGTKGVMAFFSVGKEDQENFPENPVTVTYRITDTQK